MKKSVIWILMVLMATVFAGTASADLQATIDRVELDDTTLQEGATNFVKITRDDQVDVEVSVTGLEDRDNVRVVATLQLYEFDDIADSSEVFDLVENGTDNLDLLLNLPDDIEPGDYNLEVRLESRVGDIEQNFPIRVKAERHDMKIKDILISPGMSEEAGRAFFVTVRVENLGQSDEDDIRVEVSVPELGLSDVEYIQEIENDEEEQTPQMYLPLSLDTEPGRYLLETTVTYNNGHSEPLTSTQTVEVLPARELPGPQTVIIQSPSEPTEKTDGVSKGSLQTTLEIALFVLLVILVVIGLIVGFTRMQSE